MLKMQTGVQCNVMSKQVYSEVCDKPLQSSCTKLISFGGQQLQACGEATILCHHKHKCYYIQFEVLGETVPNILGLHICMEMNLLQRIDAIETHTDLLHLYSDVFEGLGYIADAVYHIYVDQSMLSVVHSTRKVPVTP